MKLTIELVPRTCWYSNVRSNVSRKTWDVIRKKSYAKADFKCEICGNDSGRLECHEIWNYDDVNKIQTLIGMISLCHDCHNTKHIGLAEINGKLPQVIKHIMKVNSMSYDDVLKYIEDSFHIWAERSRYEWTLNIDYLK